MPRWREVRVFISSTFRDPAFMEHVPDSIREAVLEAEDEGARGKLAALKERIRKSGIPYMEDYPCEYAGLRINWRLAALVRTACGS